MSYKEKVLSHIRDYVRCNYKKADSDDFILGEINYTFRCQLNAVQKYKELKATKVYLCVAIDKEDNTPIVHFINGTKENKYQDNTWGWLYEYNDYYIIKEVNECEFERIGRVLGSTKRTLVNNNSNGFLNFIFRINENNLV